jgi:hypothetical protein
MLAYFEFFATVFQAGAIHHNNGHCDTILYFVGTIHRQDERRKILHSYTWRILHTSFYLSLGADEVDQDKSSLED